MALTEKNYWFEVRRPQFFGFARQPQRQIKRTPLNDLDHKHSRGCGCQVLVNGRAIMRGTSTMLVDARAPVTR